MNYEEAIIAKRKSIAESKMSEDDKISAKIETLKAEILRKYGNDAKEIVRLGNVCLANGFHFTNEEEAFFWKHKYPLLEMNGKFPVGLYATSRGEMQLAKGYWSVACAFDHMAVFLDGNKVFTGLYNIDLKKVHDLPDKSSPNYSSELRQALSALKRFDEKFPEFKEGFYKELDKIIA